jgi:hypothetical protein
LTGRVPLLAIGELAEEAALPGELLVVVEPDIFKVLLSGRRFPLDLLLDRAAVVAGIASSIETLACRDVVVCDLRSRGDILFGRWC